MRVAIYEVSREVPRSQRSFLTNRIIEAMTKLGYEAHYEKAMKEFSREEKILGRRGNYSVEVSIIENRSRFFFRYPTDEIDEEDEWKLDREANAIISMAFDTDLVRHILDEAKQKVEVKRHIFKWFGMAIYCFIFLSSLFLCFPIVGMFLVRLFNPLLVEDMGRLTAVKNMLPSVDVTIDASAWFLHLLMVIGLLCIYYFIIYSTDLSFAKLLKNVEAETKNIRFIRHTFIRERLL